MSQERPVTFIADDVSLMGVLHVPDSTPRTGLILVVGGPQYRAGSHRLYVLLARDLVAKGVAVLRFDCRGMGDSSGDFSGFQNIGPDILAAIDAFGTFVPSLRRYILWGLCDATLSICECAERDARIAAVVLVNPWVRTEATLAGTYLRHYYFSRLTQRDYLMRILTGKVNPYSSAKSFIQDLYCWLVPRLSGSHNEKASELPADSLVHRMATSLRRFHRPVLLILSGRDLTAKEFEDAAAKEADWQALFVDARTTVQKVNEADHSFSKRSCADQVMRLTADWIGSLEPASPG